MAFDIKGALAEGYTPTEIADYLGKQRKFDLAGARKEGYTDDEIISYLTEKKTAGPVEALVGGAKQLLSSSRTAVESPLGPSAAAVRGLERQAAMTEKPAGSLEELKRVYEQEGLFPAAKEAASQAPSVITGQLPFLAEMAGGARLGGTFFGVPGAIGGALLGPLVSYIGSNLERQAQTQMQEGKPVDADLGAAALAALPQAALDVGAMEFGLGRILKINPKLMGTERAEKLASESLIKMTAKGAAKTAAAEMPTEVIQQMIERKQAGLSLTSPDAMAEYADVLYQTGLMSPLGSMSRYLERGDAQRIMERQNKLIAAEQQRIADLKADAIKQRTFAEVNAAKAAEDALAAEQAREAALREPLTTQMELELPTQTTVEEVAARRAAAQPQGDLFTPPAPIPEAPTPTPEVLLDDDTIKSFGFASKGSNAFKALQSINDPAMPAENKLELFDAVIGAKGRLTPQQTNAVTAFREKLAVEPTEVPDVVSEAQPTADRTGVQPPSELGGAVAPVGVGESDLGGVAPVGVTPRQPDGREVTEQAPVAAAPEPVAPESTEVMKVKEDLKAIGEELESEDQLKAARSLQSELRALDPYHPLIEELGSPDVTPDVMAAAREEVDAIKQEKAAREPTSQRELRELREETTAEEAPAELPAEVDTEKAFEDAKGNLGETIRRAFPISDNIVPEERATIQDLLKAIADFMHALIRKGVRSMGQAIKQTRTEMGEHANKVTPKQYREAFNEAQTRPTTQPASSNLERLFEEAGGKVKAEKPTALQDFKDDPRNYVEQRKKEGSRFLSSLETNWFDSGAFMQSQLRKGIADLGRSWDEVRQMLYQASTSQALHAEGVAHEFLDKGAIRYDPETYKYIVDQGATSWRGAIEAIKAAAAANNISVNDMTRYAHQALVARRLKGLMARNVELETRARQLESEKDKAGANKLRDRMVLIHLSPEQIDAGMQLFSSLKGMDQIVSQWDGVRQNVLNFAVDSGLYSREDADVLLDVMDYVPFYREEQIEAKAGPREYSRGLLDTAAEKRLKGSMQDVNDVFDNMERWASYVVRKGIANKTAQNLVEAAQRYLPEGEVTPVDRTARGMRENTVAVWRDGDLQKYTFADPLYVKAFTGIESVAIPGFKALANISNILRQNIVLNPLFSIGQLSQDAFGAMFVSGVKHPFALPAQALKEFVGTLRGTSQTHEELKRLGVVGHRDYSAQVSRMDAEIAAGLREPGLYDKLKAPFQKLSMASDNAIRQAIYNQTLKETGDKALAVERAFEVINFRRAGASPANSMLRQTVPFFGAYLQAMNVAMKVIAGRGIAPTQKAEAYKILASTTAKVMLLSFIYSAMTADDDDYTKLDPTVRDRHLIIPGTGGLMIPIRPDVFTLFAKILPEHIYNLTMAEATEDGTKAKRALSDGLANAVLGPNVLPQGIKPVFEVMTNHNFFTGRPIVGMGQEMLDPERQYSLNTSELAKTMGSAMGISPMKIDHLLKAYFGYTGGTILMGMDHAIADAKGAPRPDKTYQDLVASIPGMGAFVSREFGTREMSDYYELRDMVNKSVNTFNYLKEHGTREERLAYREDKKDLLAVKSRVNKINENLAKLRTMERKVVESTDLTPEEKQEKIRTINLRRQQMLSTIGELRKRAGL